MSYEQNTTKLLNATACIIRTIDLVSAHDYDPEFGDKEFYTNMYKLTANAYACLGRLRDAALPTTPLEKESRNILDSLASGDPLDAVKLEAILKLNAAARE